MRDLISNVGTDYVAFAITGVLVLIVTLVYLWWNEQHESQLTCPGLKPKDDILGNLGEIVPHEGLFKFLQGHHKNLGPIFSFYWGNELAVSLASPQLWKDVVTLFDRPVSQFELFKSLFGASSIAYANGSKGKRIRKSLDRYFSFTAIKDYHHVFIEIAIELTTDWKRKASAGEQIPLHQHMLALAMKNIVRTTFGEEYLRSNKQLLALEKAYSICWVEMESKLSGNNAQEGSEQDLKFKKELKYMRSEIKRIIQAQKAKTREAGAKQSFLDIIIEDTVNHPTEEDMIDAVITYFVGGFHATGNALTWLVYYLCKHPEVEKKVYEEIKNINEEDFNIEIASQLTYTTQVMDETFRCSVLSPWAGCYSDYDVIIDGHLIPKKTPIILALGVVLQDKTIWPEPEKFDPDRFSEDKVKARHPLAFQPFGFAGKRKCPGYRFAYHEMLASVFYVFKNFRLKLVEPEKSVGMSHNLVTCPKEEIWITATHR